jgi:alanyl-tRNA synthetase
MKPSKPTYPQKYPITSTYPLCSDKHGRVPSTWLEKFQAFENFWFIGLINRKRGPSTTIYYSFKENKRKTKGKLGKVSYLEIFQTVKIQTLYRDEESR